MILENKTKIPSVVKFDDVFSKSFDSPKNFAREIEKRI